MVNEAAPELVQAMDDGRVSVSGAVFLLSFPKDQQAVAAQGNKQTRPKSRKSRQISQAGYL